MDLALAAFFFWGSQLNRLAVDHVVCKSRLCFSTQSKLPDYLGSLVASVTAKGKTVIISTKEIYFNSNLLKPTKFHLSVFICHEAAEACGHETKTKVPRGWTCEWWNDKR